MEKIKVLVLSSDNDGVGYYRILNPHLCMNNLSEKIECDVRLLFDTRIPLLDENFLKQYKMVIFNKLLPLKEEAKPRFYSILGKYNIKLIYDVDDYWVLDSSHLNYRSWKQQNSSSLIEQTLGMVDHVITTTPIFQNKIKELNENVSVIENGANLKEYQWDSNKIKSDKIRFIWGGGISHIPDLRLMKDDFKLFKKDFIEKTQMYMCGYDLRVRTKEGIKMDDPMRSQWTFFEDIFTNGTKYIKNYEYSKFLREYKQDNISYGYNEEFKNEWYQRRITKPILLYGDMYNEADVGLAPLKGGNHMFNKMKSQLKVIEAGAHHMPIIASNYGPYTIDDIEGKKDGLQKGWLIDEPSKGQWYEKMKYYSDNPDKIKEHGENLFNHVKNNYSMDVLTKKREELYLNIINKNEEIK
jgi:glycosyltransferase involved in cell wall biosynthesis